MNTSDLFNRIFGHSSEKDCRDINNVISDDHQEVKPGNRWLYGEPSEYTTNSIKQLKEHSKKLYHDNRSNTND